MQVSELINQIYYAFRGKGISKVPVFGSEKANLALAIANRKKNEWARDSDVTWNSNFRTTAPNESGTVATSGVTLTGTGTYFTDYKAGDKIVVSGETVRTIDTITSNTELAVTDAFTNTASGLSFTRQIVMTTTQEYSLNRKHYTPSDSVYVTNGTNIYEYGITKPQTRSNSATFISGSNPKKITFNDVIDAAAVDGTLTVPAYYIPDDMVLATDEVSVDDPNWLIYATAAELARNDAAKDDQFSNLQGMANELYRKMVIANNNTGYGTFTMPSNIPQVSPSFDEDWTL